MQQIINLILYKSIIKLIFSSKIHQGIHISLFNLIALLIKIIIIKLTPV